MDKIIGYCGLVCSGCEAYLATQADDRDALAQVVAHWREEYHAPNITIDSVICEGCLGADGRHCGHCAECDIRACGVERNVVNCGHCDDYACEKLARFFGSVPDARSVLDEVRGSL